MDHPTFYHRFNSAVLLLRGIQASLFAARADVSPEALAGLVDLDAIISALDHAYDFHAGGSTLGEETALAEAERLLEAAASAVTELPYHPLRVYDISSRDPLAIPLSFAGPRLAPTRQPQPA
jgi:hypothetical protein